METGTVRGLTAIDSFYEFLGFSLCQSLDEVLRSFWVPLIVALGGVVYATVRASERGEPKALAGYLLYLVLIVWLVAPVTLSFGRPLLHTTAPAYPGAPRVRRPVAREADLEIRAPRVLNLANAAMDSVLQKMFPAVRDRFGFAPFEWERIARMVHLSRIASPPLMWRFRSFLKCCYEPRLARLPADAPFPEPLDPSSVSAYRDADVMVHDGTATPCREAVPALRSELLGEIRTRPAHRKIVDAATAYDGGEGFEEAYLRTLCLSEWHAVDLGDAEGAQVARSVGAPMLLDPSRAAGYNTLWSYLGDALSFTANLKQEFALTQQPHQRLYLVRLCGPHILGLATMIILGFFPLAAALAIKPGGWRALVNYGKLLLSVKLVPVAWAALTAVGGARRSAEAASDVPGMVDMQNVWMAAVGMYFVAPLLSFLLVELGTRAAAAPFSGAAPPAAGPLNPGAGLFLARNAGRR